MKYLFIFLILLSCKAAKPVKDNIPIVTNPEILITETADTQNLIPNYQKLTPKPGILKRIFSPSKVKYKNATFIIQTAGAGATIGAVTTAAPKKTIEKAKPVTKVKGETVTQGEGNTVTTTNPENYSWWLGLLILVSGGYAYWKFR